MNSLTTQLESLGQASQGSNVRLTLRENTPMQIKRAILNNHGNAYFVSEASRVGLTEDVTNHVTVSYLELQNPGVAKDLLDPFAEWIIEVRITPGIHTRPNVGMHILMGVFVLAVVYFGLALIKATT